MSSLCFLTQALSEDPALLSGVQFLLRLHAEEGLISLDEKPSKHDAPKIEGSSPRPSQLQPQAVSAVFAAASTPTAHPPAGRKVGGAVPTTPYTPLGMTKHRRPHSAQVRESSEILEPKLSSPGLLGSGRDHRRGEFVDRWLAKLYLRNPVVVSQKRSDSSPSPAAPAAMCHADAVQKPWDGVEVVPLADVRDDEEIVAQLPPKPQGLQASRARQEILMERLSQCFSVPHASTPTSITPLSRGVTAVCLPPRSSSRPSSPVVHKAVSPAAAVVTSSVSSSVALPSFSSFVEKKRRAFAA